MCELGSGALSAPDVFGDDLWHHMALVRSGSLLGLFVDGDPAASLTLGSADLELLSLLTFGSHLGTVATPMELGPIRFSTSARYDGAFAPATSWESDENTAALYLASTAFEGAFLDESGAGLDGILTGLATAIGACDICQPLSALHAGDGALATTPTSLHEGVILDEELSIGFWVRFGAGGGQMGVSTRTDSDDVEGWGCSAFVDPGASTNGVVFTVAGNEALVEDVFGDDDWHHVACSYDGTAMKIAVDGSFVAEEGQTGSLGGGPIVLFHPHADVAGEIKDFDVREVGLWDFAMSDKPFTPQWDVDVDSTAPLLLFHLDDSSGAEVLDAITGFAAGLTGTYADVVSMAGEGTAGCPYPTCEKADWLGAEDGLTMLAREVEGDEQLFEAYCENGWLMAYEVDKSSSGDNGCAPQPRDPDLFDLDIESGALACHSSEAMASASEMFCEWIQGEETIASVTYGLGTMTAAEALLIDGEGFIAAFDGADGMSCEVTGADASDLLASDAGRWTCTGNDAAYSLHVSGFGFEFPFAVVASPIDYDHYSGRCWVR